MWAVCSEHRTAVGVCQHTQYVYGCLCASVCVRLCPSAHKGRLWLSISTHISTLVLGLSTLALPEDCLGDFWPTWAICSVHTGRLWVSVSTHRTSVAFHQYTYQHVGLLLSTLTLPVDCSGDFGPHVLSVQYTQDVRVCFSAHTGRSCVSVSTHRTYVAVRQHTQNVCGCPCVSVTTHRTSKAVHQYTYQHAGPWTQHAGPSCGLFG